MVEKKLLKELYVNQEMSTREIGEKLNMTHQGISYLLNRHNIPARSVGRPHKVDVLKVKEKYNNGMKPSRIALIYKVGISTIKRIIYGG